MLDKNKHKAQKILRTIDFQTWFHLKCKVSTIIRILSFKESIEKEEKKRDGTFNKNGEPSVLFTNSILSIPLGRDLEGIMHQSAQRLRNSHSTIYFYIKISCLHTDVGIGYRFMLQRNIQEIHNIYLIIWLPYMFVWAS